MSSTSHGSVPLNGAICPIAYTLRGVERKDQRRVTKDIDALMIHHVLHSMSIGLFVRFAPKTEVIYRHWGGFPGIPLAILFPEVRFHLVDSIGKKGTVAESIGEAIGLRNCG